MDAKWINKKRLNILASIHNYTANNIRVSEIGKFLGQKVINHFNTVVRRLRDVWSEGILIQLKIISNIRH